MRAKNKNVYALRGQAIIREIATHDLYCCLLPRCEDLPLGISDRNKSLTGGNDAGVQDCEEAQGHRRGPHAA